MIRILAVITITLAAWCALGTDTLSAQVADRRVFHVATQPRTWIPARASRAQPLQQKVSLDFSGLALIDALERISQRAGLKLGYSGEVRRSKIHVSLVSDSLTVLAALLQVLDGTGFQLFVSAPRGDAVLVSAGVPGPARALGTIVGRVTDAKTGHGVVKADVFLEATKWRTSSDTGGWYRLSDVDTGSYTLTVRRLGYAKQQRQVTVRAEQSDTVSVALVPEVIKLDELVTTAAGQQRRRDIGNAITTIDADSVLRTAPIRNLTDLLENRVPGLTVQHTSGAPGDPARLRLRGISSALGSNDPVVIVDGARVYATQSGERSGNLTNLAPSSHSNPNNPSVVVDPVPAPSPLDQIDPNIIEKIEVFKGPSATAMYGADAANGVIVVTTKRGRPGPAQWNANVTRGITVSAGEWPAGYYRWGRYLLTGAPRFCTLVDITCLQDSLVRFQALNEDALTILGRGHRNSLSLTTSGGTQVLTYSVTGSYANEVGHIELPTAEMTRFQTKFGEEPPDWMRRPLQYMTWSVTSSLAARPSPLMDLRLSTSLTRSKQARSTLERQLGPLAGTYVDTLNGIYYQPSQTGYALDVTPDVLEDYYVRQIALGYTFTSGLSAQWNPRPWFSVNSQTGLNLTSRDDDLLLPANLVTPTDSGYVARGTGRVLVSTFNLQGTLRRSLGRGFEFVTNLGANLGNTNTNDMFASASGLVPGTTFLQGAARTKATERVSNAAIYGWFIEPRIIGSRLSLSTGLRLDGSSNGGVRFTASGDHPPFRVRDLINPGQLFGLRSLFRNVLSLPKLNGSWVISEEPWFPFPTLFSSLRLRGAYGRAQTQPGPADHLRLYSGTTGGSASQLLLDKLGNAQLRPEQSTEIEGGFDADLFDSRTTVEVTFYRKLQVDMLLPMAVSPSVNGGGSILTNIGNVRNRGLEVSLGTTPVQSSAVTWSLQLHHSRNSNILTKMGRGVEQNKAQGFVEGYPLHSRWARPILGFADQNLDGVLQPGEIQVGDSLVYIGRIMPTSITSLNTSLVSFGGAVSLTAMFSYDAGGAQINQTARTNWVLSRPLIDPSSPLSEQASVLASTRASNPTDYGLIQNVSTFRFSTASVNFRAPDRFARLIGAQQLTLAVQGQNLALYSTYRGKDPDVNAFSPGEHVVDTGQLPRPRTWQLALFLNF